MKIANISFDITIPDNITEDNLEQFVKFELQITSQMDANIPLNEWSELNPQFLFIRKLG